MMGPEELRAELERREALLQRLHDKGGQWTDQWRVYTESIRGLQDRTKLLRIFIQASAGTGKSFLLETIFLWCVVHGYEVSACAPTGIAAARIRVPRTPVRAYTLHYLFGLSVDLESTLDPSKPEGEKMARLARMQVLITDEASMIDDATWLAIKDQLTTVGAVGAVARGEEWPPGDDFGSAHQIICCDFKQLPPATSRPPFIASDPSVLTQFEFRVLRENRRLTRSEDPTHQASLDAFHATLEDMAGGTATPAVRQFLVEAYVRGASRTQESVPFEGYTAVFGKRRYRDRWNTGIAKRSAATHGRSQKIKAVFIARGTQTQYIRETAAAEIRRSVRSQALTTLRLAGQWLADPPARGLARPHCMRAMLVSNEDPIQWLCERGDRAGRALGPGARARGTAPPPQGPPGERPWRPGSLLLGGGLPQ